MSDNVASSSGAGAGADNTNNEIEWMDDADSPCCLICENNWNLKRRRHHCRNCGRLVCKDCSNQKVKLEETDTEAKRVCDDCLVTIEEKKKIIDDGVEWMPNNFSPGCVICTEKWTLQNRRHHCRRCGRLVCKDCSLRTIKMEGDTEEKRACDECFETLELKKQVQMEANYQRERELALLNATSKVSDSLIRIYFLDGSFKTVFYDSSVTAADIIAKICFSVKIALFEVHRDIKNSTEYCLVPEGECIGDIICRWERNGAENAKFVVPIYDVNSSLRGKAPPSLSNAVLSSSKGGVTDDMVSTSKLMYRKSFSGSVEPGSYPESSSVPVGNTSLDPIAEHNDPAAKSPGNKRTSFSFFNKNDVSSGAGAGRQQTIDYPPDSGMDDQPTNRLSMSISMFGGGASQQSMDAASLANNQWNRIQEQEIQNLRKELSDLRKKYDIIRSIHVKNTKSERLRLKEEKEKKNQEALNQKKKVQTTGLGGFIDDVDDSSRDPSLTESKESGKNAKFKGAVHTVMLANSAKDTLCGTIDSESTDKNDIDSRDSTSNNSTNEMDEVSKAEEVSCGTDDDEDAVLFEGYLQRKNFFNKHATMFYFILRKKDRKLYYYNAPTNVPDLMDESVLCRYHKDNYAGKWNAKKCRASIDKNDKNKIILALTGKKVTLIAENEEMANEWAMALDNKLAGITGVGISGAKGKTDFIAKERGSSSGTFSADDIATIMKQTSSEKVRSFLDKVSETETFFVRFDEVLQSSFGDGVSNPQQTFHTYEIISAMQSLYSYILHYGEQWTADTKGWLLGMLRQTITLPIEEPEMLMAVIQCLTRENMLFAPETVNTVNQVIEMSFDAGQDQDFDSGSTIEGVLNSVKRMVETLDQVVEDLMPLLPDDFNIIKMFQEKANIKIKNDIRTFYVTNKNNLNNRDLLTLLSFADSQLHILQKFGVDTSVVLALNEDLLKQYCTVTQNLMRQWMKRIHEADIKITDDEFGVEEGFGQSTPWPGDLSVCVGEHITLAYRELTTDAAEQVTVLMLDMLPEFTNMQRYWLQSIKKLSSTTPERVCAVVNTHMRFSNILKERKETLENFIEGNTKVNNAFNTACKCFINESEKSVEVLTVLVADDFRQGLMEGLFKDEWAGNNGIAIIDTLRATLEDYIADLKVWLTLESHVKKVLSGILRAVNACYLELLLTSGVSVTGRVGERLMEDVIAITQAFHAFAPSLLQVEFIDREFKPLKDVVLFLRMDLRQMAQFVRSELYTDFGSMAVKIFSHAMCMREETKQVQEAVHEAITKGWEPIACKPLVEINYQDKFKSAQQNKGSRMSIRLNI